MFNKTILNVLFAFLVGFFLFGFSNNSQAATDLGNYPSTSIKIQPGDIIYSAKSPSTFFVGHIGIVGDDGLVYHSYPNSSGKRVDSVSNYINNLFSQSNLLVRRYGGSPAIDLNNVGVGARTIYQHVNTYDFNIHLNNYTINYCSKFVWQVYYLATGLDPLKKGYGYYDQTFIYPSEFYSSNSFYTIKTYYR